MSYYEKYKGSGIWYVKYPERKDPITRKTVYRIKRMGPKHLAMRSDRKKKEDWAEKVFYGREVEPSFKDMVEYYLSLDEVKRKKSLLGCIRIFLTISIFPASAAR